MISRITMALLTAIGLLAGSLAQAAGMGRYSGVAIGETSISVDNANFDESDLGFKLFGGYMFHKNFGLELAYIFGGTVDSNSGFVRSVESNAFTIEGIGQIPLGDRFSLFAKAGIGFYNAYVYTRYGASSNSGEDLIYGAGGSFALSPRFDLRLEWEQLDFNTSANYNVNIGNYDGSFSMISLGAIFKF